MLIIYEAIRYIDGTDAYERYCRRYAAQHEVPAPPRARAAGYRAIRCHAAMLPHGAARSARHQRYVCTPRVRHARHDALPRPRARAVTLRCCHATHTVIR